MRGKKAENLLMKIEDCFGFTKHDFKDGKPIYTVWGDEDHKIDIANLNNLSLKISKNLGNIYIDKINTDGWVIVGIGTTLFCDDLVAGMGYVPDFEGFLM